MVTVGSGLIIFPINPDGLATRMSEWVDINRMIEFDKVYPQHFN